MLTAIKLFHTVNWAILAGIVVLPLAGVLRRLWLVRQPRWPRLLRVEELGSGP
jgi:hypothetical protein